MIKIQAFSKKTQSYFELEYESIIEAKKHNKSLCNFTEIGYKL